MQGKRRSKTGRVVSDKMDKTVVVSVERLRRHPVYKRVVRLSSKFKAHDEENAAIMERVKRLEEAGYIRGYRVQLDRAKVVKLEDTMTQSLSAVGINAEFTGDAESPPPAAVVTTTWMGLTGYC